MDCEAKCDWHEQKLFFNVYFPDLGEIRWEGKLLCVCQNSAFQTKNDNGGSISAVHAFDFAWRVPLWTNIDYCVVTMM